MRVNYSFVAETPLFTGSNEKSGTLRTLRREKRKLKKPVSFESTFDSQNERTAAIMDIVYQVYSAIDSKLKRENYGFYEAYANKVYGATFVNSKRNFLTTLMKSCDVQTLPEGGAKIVRNALDKFNDVELLEVIREEHSYLMLLLREYVAFYKDSNKVNKEGIEKPTLFEQLFDSGNPDTEQLNFKKSFEEIPYFGGNSIRGYLRRLAMYDFACLTGIEKLKKETYHQLFTGGNITDSTHFEDIGKREDFIRNCPMIGLLGSAIGNMTIEGELLVQGARLQCLENGTGDVSFWEQIERNFGTRLDSSKREKAVKIEEDKEKEAPTSQMIYEYENFVTGSIFDASFILRTEDSLLISAFWRIIKLWAEQPIIGGNSARDSGIIKLNIDIPKDADKEYLDYLKANKDKIKAMFDVAE